MSEKVPPAGTSNVLVHNNLVNFILAVLKVARAIISFPTSNFSSHHSKEIAFNIKYRVRKSNSTTLIDLQ